MSVVAMAALSLGAVDLKPGDAINGFTVKSVTDLPEVKGRLVRMEYAKNGADLAWLDRDDDNMTFAIGFRTFPYDDTGVPHIIEHSVLCGSEKYPVKEPFVDLLKSSFATFLNAWTSSDATMYPVCSRNRADFMNLVDVYMDSVLHPLSVKSPMAFRQEGWHYELDSVDGELKRNGVVYSEMKGAFANPERRLHHEVRRLLYPDTCYGFVSGGDPAAIPELTFEKYKSFYTRFYHPSNARIFLDGRVDLPAVLAKLDGFLAPYPCAEVDADVVYQKPVSGAKTIEYEIGADEKPEGKVLLGDGWVFARFAQREKYRAMDVLTDALAGDNDAPLKKALLEKGLCEDVRLGVGGGAQLEVSLVVKNVKRENVDTVRRTVRETLATLAAKGLDHARLEALLDRAEFHDREKDYGGFPRGLAFFSDAYDLWLYGGDPADAFRSAFVFAQLRKWIGMGLFEKLLKEALVDNPHHVELTMIPSTTLGAKRRAEEKAELAKIKASWTKAQTEKVLAECKELLKHQSEPDRPEDVAKLPVLSVKDVPEKGPVTEREIASVDGVTVVRPRTQANGVLHMQLCFSVADLTAEEVADVPMLACVLGDLATKRHSIAALRNELDGKLGNFGITGAAYAKPGDPKDARPYVVVGVSALESRKADVLRLVPEVLCETVYDDVKAVGDLLRQRRVAEERATMGLGGRGHPFRRAAAQLSARAALEETFAGFAQIRHLQAEDAAFKANGAAYCARLAALAKKVFVKDRLVVCLSDNLPAAYAGEMARAFPRGAVGAPVAPKLLPRRSEGFRIPAGIGFAARVAHPDPSVYRGQAVVACRILSLDYLWDEIRVKGGAYGGNVRVRSDGDAGWLSWNDPKPARSLDVYANCGDALRKFAAGGDSLDRYVVSAVAATEPYLTPRVETANAATLYLSGRTPDDQQRLRREMLATTRDDLTAFAATLDALAKDAAVCVLAGPQQLEACSNRLDVVEPVVQGAPTRGGVSKNRYLDLVETAVGAYTPEHMRRYLEDVEKNGIQEHGFPRLTANLGVLLARGRRAGDRELFRRMMDACCSQMSTSLARNGGRVGNDFSVKEIVLCLLEVEKAGLFPKEVTDGWRAGIARAEPETTYSCRPKPGDGISHNWAVFGGASEQLRTFAGLNGSKEYTERHFADQMRFFDANGMYRDPNQPLVYDFVTRLQYMLALRYGYDGPCRARLEELFLKAAEPTLRLQSTSGEIPYGGRSNQFLHAETHFAAVCEWYAAWFKQRGDLKTASRFRAAAARAVESLGYWTGRKDLRHVKNRFPLETRHGCEGYGYFDKYMVTMGSWAYLGALFADESIPASEDNGATAFATTEDFHIAVLKAGDYTVQYDAPCDGHYDANGVGRVQRRGAPPMLCLAVPCPASRPKPNYTFDLVNETSLAVMPGWKTSEGWRYAYAGGDYALKGVRTVDGRARAEVSVAKKFDWTLDVAADGVVSTLAGAGEVALTLPVFEFDGERRSVIAHDARHLSVTFDGWTCTWETSGEFVDTGARYANRNGHYRRFEARGAAPLTVRIRIAR